MANDTSDHPEILYCTAKCCHFVMSPYVETPYLLSESDFSKQRVNKAGGFIYDSRTRKILLIQSRGKFFGCPKGSLQTNETLVDCALREIEEETGLRVDNLTSFDYLVIYNALYYIIDMPETPLQPQTRVYGNDANAIGWIHVDCLKDLVDQNIVQLNSQTKQLIKKILKISI